MQVQTCLRSMQLYVQQEQKKACHLSVLSIVKEYYLFKSLLNDAAMVWRNLLINKITSSLSYIHNTSSILQLLWYLYIKNYNTMYFNLFSLFFSTTTYFVLYLVWYVYDNTYNLIVDYSQFISRVFLLLTSIMDCELLHQKFVK